MIMEYWFYLTVHDSSSSTEDNYIMTITLFGLFLSFRQTYLGTDLDLTIIKGLNVPEF